MPLHPDPPRAVEPDAYWTDQLNNRDALAGYRQVGSEILEQMDRLVDVFCASVGTAGLAMGVSSALADGGSPARVVVFEPASAPVIGTGNSGSHTVEPDRLVDRAHLVVAGRVEQRGTEAEADAELAAEVGPGRTVVTVACDTGLKYLAGDRYWS